MSAPRLVIFDVDGTISDSQGHILAAMADAFAAVDQPVPPRETVLGIVGLSLDHAMPKLAPDLAPEDHQRMADGYRAGYSRRMAAGGAALVPLYPGIREVIEELAADPDTRLAIATGKSLRGLIGLLDAHGLRDHFVSLQVADHHPSKPHPSMLLTALAETGIAADRAVMIGDTSFDMDMARAAGIAGIAVGWGYHPARELGAAHAHVRATTELPAAIERVLAGT
ncbi:HAD-IA family hydrolase [Pseudooceanicola sp.]|uniref:HAD-IA family hydrolase n=1 Tax=Pseudooceanicola sp. TaxID=1914328 RepID=UPI0026082E51|nr:HAD-IA family hydrolase [Pseudooceanicola sp.]MDF1856934.1 HAD-IA family hydrolase [Pseudooceanicola sp.]